MKTINKIILFVTFAIVALCACATSALAHISVHPNTIPAGAFATLDVRVPGEQQGAHVTKVDMLFPAGFTDVNYEGVPGWSVKVIERKLATPLHSDGETIDSEIAQLVWTWTGPLGEVGDGQFVQFPLSVAIPADATEKVLEFRTVQHYSDGQVVRWIDASLSAEHPSPRINVSQKGGQIEDVAGEEAGPVAGEEDVARGLGGAAAALARPAGGASDGLALAALIVGALALLTALFALVSLQRRREPRR
jgi:uncharacterized protein YcnI